MTVSTDLQSLLDAVTWDNWPEMLPILHDAYYDSLGEAARDAVQDIIDHGRKPDDTAYDEDGNRACCWWNNCGSPSASLGEMTGRIDAVLSDEFGVWSGITANCGHLLHAFVIAWEEGHRPG